MHIHLHIYVRIYVDVLAMWSSSNNNLSGGNIKDIGYTQWSPDVYIFKIHSVVLLIKILDLRAFTTIWEFHILYSHEEVDDLAKAVSLFYCL